MISFKMETENRITGVIATYNPYRERNFIATYSNRPRGWTLAIDGITEPQYFTEFIEVMRLLAKYESEA